MRSSLAVCSLVALLIAHPAASIEDDRLIPPAELPQPGAQMGADELIRKYPADPRGYILAANAAMRTCALPVAEREIRTALERAQKHPMFTNNARLRTSMRRMLASVLAMSQQFDKALTEAHALVESDPANTEFLYMRAQTYVQLGQLEKALDDAGKVIDLDNTHFKAWQLRGFVEYRLQRFQEAATTFTLIAENTPDYPPIILGMRGQAHAANGKYDLALENYDAALALAQKQRAEGYSDEIVEQEIALKKANAEAARTAEAASPQDARRIRADLFAADQRSLLPTNSLKCQ
jgi:tetratricopeptide (TPR) repeat protein